MRPFRLCASCSSERCQSECDRGIFVGGVGYGSAMIANKVCGIFACVCQDPVCAELARQHNDANVLCIGGKIIGSVLAMAIAKTWMATEPLTAEEYVRRRNKVTKIDEEYTQPLKRWSRLPLDPEEASFFSGHEEALPLYATLMQQAEDVLTEFCIHVQKTQITLLNRHVFACVSPLAVRRKARIPQSSITLTFGLNHPLASARIVAKTEAYPGRWTHHLVICDAAELDSELLAWLHEACELAACKRRGAPDGRTGSLLEAAHEDGRQPGQSEKARAAAIGFCCGILTSSQTRFNQMPCGINSRICLRPCSMLSRNLAAHTALCTGRRCSAVRRATPLGAADSYLPGGAFRHDSRQLLQVAMPPRAVFLSSNGNECPTRLSASTVSSK